MVFIGTSQLVSIDLCNGMVQKVNNPSAEPAQSLGEL